MLAMAEEFEQQPIYQVLAEFRLNHPNEELFARMLDSWSQGLGALPAWLGLGESGFAAMFARYFAGAPWPELPQCAAPDAGREAEREELRTLLLLHRAGRDRSEEWLADIVSHACMASDHLWQDLGLWSRQDLSALMADNFPALKAKNDRDMKWKKFLYKQLCNQEGIYTCRSPSCEVCADYQACFGPED